MSEDRARPRVYLAGPEVFLPDALGAGARKLALCAAAGLEGLFPLDQSLDVRGLKAVEQARRIALANEALMRSADAMIANLTPFRGVSADAGTAFEVGFMRALGRPVFAYSASALDYEQRVARLRATATGAGDGDRADYAVERFGLADNLMIDVAVRETGLPVVRGDGGDLADLGAFEVCLAEAARVLLA